MSINRWKVILGATIGAMVIAASAVVAAAPYSAVLQAAATATSVAGAATAVPGATTAAPDAHTGDPAGGFHGPRAQEALLNATASVTGLTLQDVISQTQAGQSLTQIAVAKGKTADDVIQAARAALAAQLQADVTAGKLAQAQADAALVQFDQDAPGIVANTSLKAGFGHGPHGQGGPRTEDALVNATASVTGLTAQAVISQTQTGQSLAQIATAQGKTAADAISAARASLVTQLGQAVTAGNLTQAQADAELAEFEQNATQIMNDTTLHTKGGPGFGFGGPRGAGGPGGAGALIQAAVSVTGLTDQEIDTQLQAGQTLAQIAQSKGKTADDVIAAARTALTTQLQAAVTAGKLTQAQADAQLAQFNTNATQLMNDATLGQQAGGPGGRGGHHGGPGGFGGPNGANGANVPGSPAPTATAPTGAANS